MIIVVWCSCSVGAQAQQHEIEQLLLNVEKLAQFKQILQDMKDGYEILAQGYETIKNISEGNFTLHQGFLDGLLEVSPTVRKYHRITDITRMQIELVQQYKTALRRFRTSELFHADEMQYIEGVYQRLFRSSLHNLEDLVMVITAGTMRMSDDERLKAIDRIFADLNDKLVFLRSFNDDNGLLLLRRMNEQKNVKVLERMLDVQE